MSAVLAPAAWPGSPAASAPMRLAQRPATGLQWAFKRNCSLTPDQLLVACAAVALLSVLVGALFWAMGLPGVLPFAGLELLALGTAFVCHARHAGDRETLSLCAGRLVIEQHCGPRLTRTDWPATSVRLAAPAASGALVVLCHGPHALAVGRHLGASGRQRLRSELRQALQAPALESNQLT